MDECAGVRRVNWPSRRPRNLAALKISPQGAATRIIFCCFIPWIRPARELASKLTSFLATWQIASHCSQMRLCRKAVMQHHAPAALHCVPDTAWSLYWVSSDILASWLHMRCNKCACIRMLRMPCCLRGLYLVFSIPMITSWRQGLLFHSPVHSTQ